MAQNSPMMATLGLTRVRSTSTFLKSSLLFMSAIKIDFLFSSAS